MPPPTGSTLGIAADDGLFDPLTIIGGTIELADGAIRQSFDCRFPTNTDAEKLTAAMTAVCARLPIWKRSAAGSPSTFPPTARPSRR